jgi:hypothetical protein
MTPIGEQILVNVVCALIGLIAGNRLTLGRDRVLKHESDIKADKLEFIPLIDRVIMDAANHCAPNIVRMQSYPPLNQIYLRFRIHLKGRHLRALDKAWQELAQTTESEMVGNSGNGVFADNQSEELHKVQKILISRLESFRAAINNA